VVYLVLYVDDLLIIGNNESYIASIKNEFNKGFEIANLGHLHYYLGVPLGYSDSDFVGDKENGVSTLGYLIVLDQMLSLGDHTNS
jgi:hypothetical protein